MLIYIVKVTTCLAIFYAFYKLLLERESMHNFKRYYLLAAVVSAFIIPALIFTGYVYVTPEPTFEHMPLDFQLEEFQTTAISEPTSYLSTILWSVYALGVLVFGFKFVQNLFIISNRIKKNPKVKEQTIIYVLLKEQLAPHTFFNFIFFNQQKFTANEIPAAVVLHEKTHAYQKHSIDVLLMELVQVFLWFNPFVYLFKKVIKLNHEFLADQAVMQKGIEITTYQKILLAFSSNASSPETALTNAINYSSIKKRFTVMKKNTSKKAVWLRSLLVLPLVALLVYSFSEKEVLEVQLPAENDVITNIKSELDKVNDLEINYVQEKKVAEYKTKPVAPTTLDFEKWKNKKEFAIWINSKEIINSELKNYQPTDFFHYFSSFVYNNARSERFPQAYQINIYTKSEFEKHFTRNDTDINIRTLNSENSVMVQNDVIKISELKDYLYQLNKTLSKEDRQKLVRVEFYRNSKTSEEIINQIEEILNDYGYATIDIKGSELKDNKNTIEKSESPETGFVEIKNTWHFFVIKKNKKYYYNLEGFETDNSGEIISKTRVNASDVIPNSYITKVYKDGKVVVNFKDNWNEAQKKENLNTAITAKGISQDGATKEQISEYNAIASKYSDMNTAKQIKKSEIDRMNYLYNLMTDKQKKSVANFPEIPPMPPLPPNTPELKKEMAFQEKQLIEEEKSLKLQEKQLQEQEKELKKQESQLTPKEGKNGFIKINDETFFYNINNGKTEYYNRYGQIVDDKGKVIDSPTVKKGELSNIPPPPPPPFASNLEYVIDMAKKEATFYYEDEIITADKAIKLLKENKNLNIDSRGFNSNKPVVRISKKPIKTEK